MKRLLLVLLALVTVFALASCDISDILGTGTNQGDGSYAEDENQNSEDVGDDTDPENPGTEGGGNTDPENPGTEGGGNTDPEKPGNDDNYSEGFAFTLDSKTASYSVTGIGTCTDEDIEIPATYDGKPVTSIGSQAFYNCFGLTSVTIPDSVTSIGASAFSGCRGLTSVTIPNGVTSIGAGAFGGCSSLTSVTIPDSVTSIGDWAFSGCRGLTSVTIPDSVTSIGGGAFWDCTSLDTVYYAGTKAEWSKISIGLNNSDLTSVTRYYYSETEPEADGNYWHYDENGNAVIWHVYVVSVGLEYTLNSDKAFYSVTGIGTCNDRDIIIPATYDGKPVTSISGWAFKDCLILTSVTIPDSVTSIGSGVFWGCQGLTSVTIGNGVTSIGNHAFHNCWSLTSILVAEGNTAYKSIDGNLYSADGKTLILYATGKTNESFTIPDSVLSIGDEAFFDCSGLTKITIPNSVLSIGSYAFSGCSGLTSITIPNSVLSIDDWAFSGCSGLTSVTIPDSVTSIGDWAFKGCSGLTSVTIPDSVTSIGDGAFYYCGGLTSITIGNSVTSIGDEAFRGCWGLTTVYYAGTKAEWAKIIIGSDNSKLTSATRYYYSETAPIEAGNYWHYDENGNVVIWSK